MAPQRILQALAGRSLSLYNAIPLYLLSFSAGANALAHPAQIRLGQSLSAPYHSNEIDDAPLRIVLEGSDPISENSDQYALNDTLQDLLGALNVMQDHYFELWQGIWLTSIDWTAAVLGTHVSATLSSLTDTAIDVDNLSPTALENTINRFFSQVSTFYFGENAFSLRNQAYDDMLWVVLGWLENIKFQELHSGLHFTSEETWYGTQFQHAAAHRARLFYELASAGWDTTLCDGGMIWSPHLKPYKNAITNELFVSASIGMYLYYPGDPIDSPFLADMTSPDSYPHDPAHLKGAVEGYKWLKNSNMTGIGNLYGDGFHISGWRSISHPGSRKCDELNTMVYTYNQGVILSGLRGLWLATGASDYLDDGHALIFKVIGATGWLRTESEKWAGLGRGGVMEDACDSRGDCSQDGHTFKGIFFHHLAEFCRPLRPQEEQFLASDDSRKSRTTENWLEIYERHLARCRLYGPWIEHNAQAALATRDRHGRFGMWWGRSYSSLCDDELVNSSTIPVDAVDYRNGLDGIEVSVADVRLNDYNDRGRGRTVETQSGGIAVLRALYQWQTCASLS